jgi:hypothetical protein
MTDPGCQSGSGSLGWVAACQAPHGFPSGLTICVPAEKQRRATTEASTGILYSARMWMLRLLVYVESYNSTPPRAGSGAGQGSIACNGAMQPCMQSCNAALHKLHGIAVQCRRVGVAAMLQSCNAAGGGEQEERQTLSRAGDVCVHRVNSTNARRAWGWPGYVCVHSVNSTNPAGSDGRAGYVYVSVSSIQRIQREDERAVSGTKCLAKTPRRKARRGSHGAPVSVCVSNWSIQRIRQETGVGRGGS